MLKLAIIGGGPAGLSAAIWAAKNDIRVTLVENNRKDRISPGEALHPGMLSIFRMLGIEQDINSLQLIRFSGCWTKWNNKVKLVSFGEDNGKRWYGYQILKEELEEILENRAVKLGANILRSCQALNITISQNKINRIKTSRGDLETDFVIDASGRNHWLAKMLGIEIQRFSPMLLVFYGYVSGLCSEIDDNPSISSAPHGWIWLAKVKKNIYQWIRMDFCKNNISPNWLPNKFKKLRIIQPARGVDVTWRCVSIPSALNYFIVGDAFSILDPSSSHGILRAIATGIKAAHLIEISSIKNKKFEYNNIFEGYNRWAISWFMNDFKSLREFYHKHPCPPIWL